MANQLIQTIYLNYPSSAQTETISVTPSGGTGPYAYSWTRSNCNSTAVGSSFTTGNTGSYAFTPTASMICRQDSSNVYGFVVTVTDAHGCTGTSNKNINVVNPYSGTQVKVCHRTAIAHTTPTYSLILVNQNQVATHLGHGDYIGNCYSFAGRHVAEEEVAGTMSVYPNPTTGIFKVTLSEVKEEANILVTDMAGRVIFRRILNKDAAPETSFDLSSLSSGMYLVTVKDGDRSYRAKIVLE
jgi:hypothetical protein